jgi:hypothetical protein
MTAIGLLNLIARKRHRNSVERALSEPLGHEHGFAKWHFVPFSDNCQPHPEDLLVDPSPPR